MDLAMRPEVDATSRQDPQHVEALIEAYAPLVKYIAHRLACRLPASVGLEDLISAGVLGLLDAITKYDPQRQTLFKTYAECRIRGAMLDYVRELDWVPRSVRAKEQALVAAYTALERQQGRPATDEDVAAWLGHDLATFHRWLTEVRGVSVLSLETPLAYDAEGHAFIDLAQLADGAPGPCELAETQELKQHLAEVIDALPQQELTFRTLFSGPLRVF